MQRWLVIPPPLQIMNLAAILFLLTAALPSQWVNVPLPNTPRTPAGKPNLSAPTPRTRDGKPDLSGVWRSPDGRYLNDITADGITVPFTPEGAALYKQRQENFSKDRPSGRCLPHGVPDSMLVPATPFKIVQTAGVTVILFENQGHFRQVFTDGRGFPQDMTPSWLGYSIGRWEGETFVVESRGFNALTYLDDGGHPHSESYHAIERFTRPDFGHLNFEITIDDPKEYTRQWKVPLRFELFADNELMESVCENEKDAPRLVGK